LSSLRAWVAASLDPDNGRRMRAVGAGSAVPARLRLPAETACSVGCASGHGRSWPLPDLVAIASALRPAARRLVRQLAYGAIAAGGAAHWLLRSRRHVPVGGRIDRILIIRLDLLGDVLFSMHAVEALRAAYPAARIVMLTLPYTEPLARLSPAVDEVVSVDTNRIRTPRGLLSPATWSEYRQTYRHVRSQKFDLCVSLSGRMASLCAFLSGARRTVGYSREAYPFLLTDPVAGGRYAERMHEVEYVRRLARHAGASSFPERVSLTVPEEACQAAERLLTQHDITASDMLVVIHAGSVHPSAKRWPARSWSRFVDDLNEVTGARIVLTGSKSDEPVAVEVLKNVSRPIVSLVGRTTVEELLGLLARADLVAGGDSGPLHLAVALGRPVVAAYGPTDPRIYGPYNPVAPTELHRKDLPCSPCYPTTASPDCPLGDPICMRLVTVQKMVESAVDLLS